MRNESNDATIASLAKVTLGTIILLILMIIGGFTLIDYLKKSTMVVVPQDVGITKETKTKEIDDTGSTNTKTEYWVREANAKANLKGDYVTWSIHIRKESMQIRSSKQDIPATGAVVTAELRGKVKTPLTGTVGSDGWVSWTKPTPKAPTGLYILDIQGELPWSLDNQALWKDREIASYAPSF